jgi:RimJ/RimL family protein N-acetyltransferase
MNVLIDKSTGRIVGQCGLLVQEVDNDSEFEIGYSILPEYRRMGFATEAAHKCRDFAFNNSFSETLISIIHNENENSEKVAVKNGMKKTKRTVYKEMPVNIFRITKDDWLSLKN